MVNFVMMKIVGVVGASLKEAREAFISDTKGNIPFYPLPRFEDIDYKIKLKL
jgi:hypothetical protein